MKRYDLRHLGKDFGTRLGEIIGALESGESAIFVFEVGDFSSVQQSADIVQQQGCNLLNSLRFNEVDWTIVVRREP